MSEPRPREMPTPQALAERFLLSLRLRRREIETMQKIGGSRRRIVSILASEIVIVLVAGALCAAFLTALTAQYGPMLVKALVLR